MATLNLENFPDRLYERLREQAQRQRPSLAQEVIYLLEQAVEPPVTRSILELRGLGKAVTPEAIFQIATGFMAAKHLFVANSIGLFAALPEEGATLEQIAARTGGEGESYSDEQARAWLAATGWEADGPVQPLAGPQGLLAAKAV